MQKIRDIFSKKIAIENVHLNNIDINETVREEDGIIYLTIKSSANGIPQNIADRKKFLQENKWLDVATFARDHVLSKEFEISPVNTVTKIAIIKAKLICKNDIFSYPTPIEDVFKKAEELSFKKIRYHDCAYMLREKLTVKKLAELEIERLWVMTDVTFSDTFTPCFTGVKEWWNCVFSLYSWKNRPNLGSYHYNDNLKNSIFHTDGFAFMVSQKTF